MAIKDLDKRKDVARNLKFKPDEMDDLRRYAEKYNLKPATALRVVLCSELENFMMENEKEITMHFSYEPEKKEAAGEHESVVVCKLPTDAYANILKICKTTGMNQQAFIKYLVKPRIRTVIGAGKGI